MTQKSEEKGVLIFSGLKIKYWVEDNNERKRWVYKFCFECFVFICSVEDF